MTLQHLRPQCLEIFLLRCLLSFWNVNLGGKTRRIVFIFFYMYVCIQINVRRTLKGGQGWSLCSWALGISKCWLYDLYHALIHISEYCTSSQFCMYTICTFTWFLFKMFLEVHFFSFLNHWYFLILTRIYSYISSTVIREYWFPGVNIK